MLEIDVNLHGAELTSIKKDGVELLHDGINFWNRHSPILFPIVGKLKDNKTLIENREYFMGQHGFARDMDFVSIGNNTYLLEYNEETLKKYPYKFKLFITYTINNNSLEVKYRVENVDDKKIYFGIGGHPAFKCDYTNKDCYIEFIGNTDNIEVYQLNDGLLDFNIIDKNKFIKSNRLILEKNIFNNDAIIFKNISNNKVLLFENNKQILEFDLCNFKYLGVWSKVGSSFVCIEPWMNTADRVDSDGQYINKEDIICLDKDKFFECFYIIKF